MASALPRLSLEYQAIIPDGTEQRPLLLLLHGRGADEHDLLPLAQSLPADFVVVSARAPLSRWGGYHWYDLHTLGEPEPTTYQEGLRRLRQFFAELPGAFPIDAARIFVLGFSQGAMMAGSLLFQEASVHGIVMLSGYLPIGHGVPEEPPSLGPKLVFIGHGTADNVLPVTLGRQANEYLRQSGCIVTYREYPMAHQITPQEIDQVETWLQSALADATASTLRHE